MVEREREREREREAGTGQRHQIEHSWVREARQPEHRCLYFLSLSSFVFTFVFPTVLCFYIFFSTVLSATTSYATRYIVVTRRINPGSSGKPLGLQKNRSTLQDTIGPIPSNAPACFKTYWYRNFRPANAENYTFWNQMVALDSTPLARLVFQTSNGLNYAFLCRTLYCRDR